MHDTDADLKNQIMTAATDHLHAKSALEALGHYTKDIVAVSNQNFFESFHTLAEDVTSYYEILKEVKSAHWRDDQIRIINQNVATFTAKFDYCFTTIENKQIDLTGIWSAVFVKIDEEWKIQLRHESFVQK